MSTTLAWTALLMGVAGGPHCLGMCAAPCAGLVRATGRSSVAGTVQFQLGRLLGYSAAGALAASAMQSLAFLTSHTSALRPVWTLLHVAIFAWGLLLLLNARQPAWAAEMGRYVWAKVQPLVAAPGGLLMTGLLWTLRPCGLLYSALLVAALSGGALQGAVCMALFAAASGALLVAGPWLWLRLRGRVNHWRQDWGSRLAGLMLAGVAGWALWMDLWERIAPWCQ